MLLKSIDAKWQKGFVESSCKLPGGGIHLATEGTHIELCKLKSWAGGQAAGCSVLAAAGTTVCTVSKPCRGVGGIVLQAPDPDCWASVRQGLC